MDVFLARQPIFNRSLQVEGYELLYRFDDQLQEGLAYDGDRATSKVIAQSILVTNFDKLVANKLAFINFSDHLILQDIPLIFDPHKIVIELLKTIVVTDELLHKIKKLRLSGYRFAVDITALSGAAAALVEHMSIIKVNYLNTTSPQRVACMADYKHLNVQFLAEKLETREGYREAQELGFHYFQGYFFAKPDEVKYKEIEPLSTTYLSVMQELSSPDPKFGKLAEMIEADVSVSFKLLKLINSAAFYRRTKIQSIEQALVVLGLNELRKWIMLLMLQSASHDKPAELIATVLIRAKLMATIGKRLNLPVSQNECFLTGMLSLIDVMTEQPMASVLSELSLSDEIVNAIIKREMQLGSLLDVVEGYEQTNVDQMHAGAERLKFNLQELPLMYFESMEWVDQLIHQS